ncbi:MULTISPECIES: hypothetical protein [Marinobacter]|uniref:Uncharacterized protein n=1 Tax=Marinobacter metalliresistant TaxID=2961995 RepID=A0ABZ2VXB4_9GAMM|nr:hypothetical protein [Marinobacter sp. Arc7-DN-1]
MVWLFSIVYRRWWADDGLRFDLDTLNAGAITEDADYQGLRVTFTGFPHR